MKPDGTDSSSIANENPRFSQRHHVPEPDAKTGSEVEKLSVSVSIE